MISFTLDHFFIYIYIFVTTSRNAGNRPEKGEGRKEGGGRGRCALR